MALMFGRQTFLCVILNFDKSVFFMLNQTPCQAKIWLQYSIWQVACFEDTQGASYMIIDEKSTFSCCCVLVLNIRLLHTLKSHTRTLFWYLDCATLILTQVPADYQLNIVTQSLSMDLCSNIIWLSWLLSDHSTVFWYTMLIKPLLSNPMLITYQLILRSV